MSDIAVAHLVRPAHGIETFESFLDAYSTFDAGVNHELIVIFKGFAEDGRELEKYHKCSATAPIVHSTSPTSISISALS